MSHRDQKLNRLSEEVTNTIDSNKTITKLSTVVKELIENSIDAKSKNIFVFIKDGGLSLIEVKDDGKGILKEDFEKLCKRYNSSKLTDYDIDMLSLNTFGFRGEALSILSYISQLTIISRNEKCEFGHEATFKNGKSLSDNLKRVPMDIGTIIRIENIFYNNLVRKNYYDKNEETKDILNLLSFYSFHFHTINFSLSCNLFSNKILMSGNIHANKLDDDILLIKKNLAGRLFNTEISENLFYFNNTNFLNNKKDLLLNIDLISKSLTSKINFECYFTKPSANLSKTSIFIFLNDRLIASNSIKKLFDQTYSKFLIKHGNYFAYLSITCNPSIVDFNVKGDKSEVFIKDEEKLLQLIRFLLEHGLNQEISSKNYYTGEYNGFSTEFKKKNEILYSCTDGHESLYAKDKIRVDTKTVSIEKYLTSGKNSLINNVNNNLNNFENERKNEILKILFLELFNQNNKNQDLTDILKNSHFIGYESNNSICFIQYNTSLYIINLKFLINEFIFYNIIKNNSDKISSLKIKSTFTLENLISFIFDNLNNNTLKHENIKNIENLISEKKDILHSLNLKINENCQLYELIFYRLFDFENSSFLNYVPMLYYSIIEHLYKSGIQSKNNIFQSNDNLNLLIDILKIISHYLTNFYFEKFSKLPTEEINKLLKNILFYEIKTSDFFIRKNIVESELLEKIIDTETLYTVFERC